MLSIPFKASNSEDKLCWPHSKDGILHVKDVYGLSLKSIDGASCLKGPNAIWKKLWKLKVPPKVCDFMWRVCWDIIPHGMNLARKGVSEFIHCKRCGGEESLLHVLRDCPWAKDAWAVGHIPFPSGAVASFRLLWISFGVLLGSLKLKNWSSYAGEFGSPRAS
ncbi:unnamed protein product [Amaranthus hypochondriacus]